MSLLEKSESLLKSKLLKENQAYNFKLLSRELGIHVSDGKKLLYSFYKKHHDLISVTYIIVGNLHVGDIKSKNIKLTNDLTDLERFETVDSVDVYSLCPLNVQIEEAIGAINQDIRRYNVTQDKLKQWGVIRGPALVQQAERESVDESKKEQIKSAPATAPTAGGSGAPKKKEFPDMGLRSAAMLARNTKETQEKESIKKKPTQPAFGRSPARPDQIKAGPVRRSKTEPASRVETVEDAELNDEEYIKKQIIEKEEKLRKQKELESMFDDDDGDDVGMTDSINQVQEAQDVDDEADTQKIESQLKGENKEFEDIFDTTFSQSQSQSQKHEFEEEPTKEEKRDEPEQYYDEDGYLVTKKKLEPKPKQKASSANKRKTSPSIPSSPAAVKKSKTGPKQQSSLMSFFGKK